VLGVVGHYTRRLALAFGHACPPAHARFAVSISTGPGQITLTRTLKLLDSPACRTFRSID